MDDIKNDVNNFERMVRASKEVVDSSSRPWKWAVTCLVVTAVLMAVCWAVSATIMNNRYMDTIDKLTAQIVSQE